MDIQLQFHHHSYTAEHDNGMIVALFAAIDNYNRDIPGLWQHNQESIEAKNNIGEKVHNTI